MNRDQAAAQAHQEAASDSAVAATQAVPPPLPPPVLMADVVALALEVPSASASATAMSEASTTCLVQPLAGVSPSPRAPNDWQPPSAEEVAKWLPQWSIDKLLGCGGMAAVYRGWQAGLTRHVAVKIMRPDFVNEAAARERFRREGQALVKLQHRFIPKALDAGFIDLPAPANAPGIHEASTSKTTASGLAYLVMEFVDGTSLATRLANGPLTPSEVLRVGIGVAEALGEAHQLGILHRDIKPDNILLDLAGNPWLSDFGIALWTQGITPSLQHPVELRTVTGAVAGTPGYVAPELVMGLSQASVASDIYSVGRTLERALLGHGVQRDEAAPLVTSDARYRALISIACHPDPARRHPSAEALLADLQALRDMPVTVPLPFAQRAVRPPALPAMAVQAPPPSSASQVPPLPGRQAQPEPLPPGFTQSWWWRALAALPWAWLGKMLLTLLRLRLVQIVLAILALLLWLRSGSEVIDTTGLDSSTADSPWRNSLGMQFVRVPSWPVAIGIRRVTRAEYAQFASSRTGLNITWQTATFSNQDPLPQPSDPVMGISAIEAAQFCEWLSKKEGVRYRLPTSAEWRAAMTSQWVRYVDQAPAYQQPNIPIAEIARSRFALHGTSEQLSDLGLQEFCVADYEWATDPNNPQQSVVLGGYRNPEGLGIMFGWQQSSSERRFEPESFTQKQADGSDLTITVIPWYYFRCVIELPE